MSGVMPPLPMYAVTIRTGSTIFYVGGGGEVMSGSKGYRDSPPHVPSMANFHIRR